MMRILRKPLSLLLSLLMVLGMITAVPLTASAADAVTLTATDNGQLTVNAAGEYIFTGTADMCTLDIYSDCTLTLRNLCLTNTENDGTYGVRIHSGTTSLIISGENTITAGGQGGNSVPIGVEASATLILSGENDEDENNILNAVGTSDGKAAIGGAWDGYDIGWNCGTIIINSGTVNAVGGGNYASVIGRGGEGVIPGDSDKSVTVNGGIITAELKSRNGAYIGGGGMTTTYNGGIVTQIDEDGEAVTINYNIEPVDYIDADGSTQTSRNYTLVTGSEETLTAGWHVVTENVEFNERIRCEGDVRLIICDNMTLTASKGIQVAGSGNSLTVYGQDENSGVLLVPDANSYCAGIGGDSGESLSSVTINGASVSVQGGENGAGIGGGYQSSSDVGSVTVNGGVVIAQGGSHGAGIGGGRRGNGVNFTMNGGEVTATGGQAAAGIGSSDGVNENDTGIQLNAGDVTINGGKVTAQGGDWSAGIGGGNECHCGNILITGGEVTATGGSRGAGIGSGIVWKDRTSAPLENTNTITITGGVVTATGGNLIGFGGDGAACIGSGDWAERSWPYSEASVNISGGTVKAFGSYKGIGGNNSRVAITGGTIEAYTIESTDSITLSWTENSDSIFTYGYSEEVTLAKSFTDSDGTIYNKGEVDNIFALSEVKLLPYIPNSYTVTWKNYNGTVLRTDVNVPAGETPVYNGSEPVREPDDTYSYTFSGWSPEVTAVTADAIYTATYTQVVNAAARIDNTEYPSLAEAYEAAADGDTVVLLRDRSENLSDLTVGKTLTLDLNGHQFYAGTVRVGAEGDLTVTDTSDEPSAVGLNLSKIVVAEGGAFTMNSGTLTNSATLVFTFEGSGTTLITGNTVLQPGSGDGFSTLTRSDIVEISGSAVVNGVFAHPGGFSLTGGYYQHQPQSEYVAAGYMLLEPAQSDKQDYYQVVPRYVAQVGEALYQFFTDAVTAANGAAITLLADISDPYTMTVGQTLNVIKDGHSLTVNPPEGNYLVKAADSSVTTGEGEGAVTVTTTTYTVAGAVAKVNDTLYDTFADAVTAANGAAITLLADISDPYTMAVGQTIKVIKADHTLTVNPPVGNYLVKATDSSVTTGEGESAVTVITTTYTVAGAVAKVNDTLYDTFAEAVTAANGATITLLANILDPYTMAVGQTIKVIKDDHTLTVNPPAGNYFVKATDNSVTTGEGESAVTITTTTYTVVGAVAKVNDTLYSTFPDAANAANGATITLLYDISDPYTMAVGQTIKVIKDDHTLTVNPPSIGYFVVQSTAGGVTTYTLNATVATVNGVGYRAFSDAAAAAGGSNIMLLADVDAPYTLAEDQTLRVILGGHTLTVNAPSENHRLITTAEGSVTVYSSVKYYAQVDSTKYESFSAAATASGGTKNITLLRNMDEAYSLSSYGHEILRVVKNGFTANITGAVKTKDKDGVTYYYKSEEASPFTGSGFAYAAGGIVIGAATAAIIYYDEYVAGGAAATTVTLGAGSSLTLESSEGFEFEAENPAEECLQREVTEEGLTKITNLRTYLVNIDTGISILDVGSDVLPDCVNEIWDDYSKNTASIIKIAPPVLEIVSYTDIRLIFPYPEGWFFPPIPYLPEAMNPGNHFVCFTEGSSWYTYGTPFVGTIVTGPLSISGVWVPYEAAVVKANGSKEYYLAFTDAAAASDRMVVEILSAPMASYTLKKTGSDPDVYETLKVKRGSYTGSCVNAPDNLPDGYSMRTWTYSDDSGDVITCYTVDKPVTVTLVYNNGSANSTHAIYSNQIFSAPAVPVKAGCTFSGWYTDAQLTQPYDFTKYVYNDLTLYAKWTDNPRYSVSVGNIKNGTVTVNKASTYAGDTVVVTPTPGYNSVLRSLTYTVAGGAATPITATAGVYSFVMPEGAVAVDATFDRKYFSGHSLSLNGDIGVNFYVDLTPEEAANATVSFSWTVEGIEKTASVDIGTAKHTDHGYKASCHVAPAEMTYAITATLTIGGEVAAADTYSVRQYAEVILSDDYRDTYTGTGAMSYANLSKLVKAMLDYGSRAQIFFRRDANNPANGGNYVDHTGDPVIITSTMSDMTAYLDDYGLEYTGSAVVLLTETSIRHYYTVTDEDKFGAVKDQITFNREDPGYTRNGSEIYFELTNISANNIDTVYTLHIGTDDYDYAVTDYIKSCLDETGADANEQEQALVTAMYYYNRAANACFSD